ncbi:hypothetical protein Bca52824_023628 [Brassica carinata]|uniref:Uncharacterized protein n=1 Tax=Brassica carinata TaxID=52824 RepID=A0A8X7VIU6_BRACI|nr:hypothetical protein Bca52824_023628 [Brassica carinata]
MHTGELCNLNICLMKQGRIDEAKETLRCVKPAVVDGPRGVDPHSKLLCERKGLESCWSSNQRVLNFGNTRFRGNVPLIVFLLDNVDYVDSNTMGDSVPEILALSELKYPIGPEPKPKVHDFIHTPQEFKLEKFYGPSNQAGQEAFITIREDDTFLPLLEHYNSEEKCSLISTV